MFQYKWQGKKEKYEVTHALFSSPFQHFLSIFFSSCIRIFYLLVIRFVLQKKKTYSHVQKKTFFYNFSAFFLLEKNRWWLLDVLFEVIRSQSFI